ncbi:MAG: flagellar hook-length control protein FliK [Clostridiales bacterium]|nr:flagellar hook-length control protein FliK [Clostridiales bacterium]
MELQMIKGAGVASNHPQSKNIGNSKLKGGGFDFFLDAASKSQARSAQAKPKSAVSGEINRRGARASGLEKRRERLKKPDEGKRDLREDASWEDRAKDIRDEMIEPGKKEGCEASYSEDCLDLEEFRGHIMDCLEEELEISLEQSAQAILLSGAKPEGLSGEAAVEECLENVEKLFFSSESQAASTASEEKERVAFEEGWLVQPEGSGPAVERTSISAEKLAASASKIADEERRLPDHADISSCESFKSAPLEKPLDAGALESQGGSPPESEFEDLEEADDRKGPEQAFAVLEETLGNEALEEAEIEATAQESALRQMIGQIKASSAAGLTRLRITLKPESLGEVTLKVTSENGVIAARFTASDARAKEIIESGLGLLRDALREQGLNLSQLSVNVSGAMDEGAKDPEDRGRQPKRRQEKRGEGRNSFEAAINLMNLKA